MEFILIVLVLSVISYFYDKNSKKAVHKSERPNIEKPGREHKGTKLAPKNIEKPPAPEIVSWRPAGNSASPETYRTINGKQAKKAGDPYWIPPGKDITVLGYLISGGMIYVGQTSWDSYYRNENPAIIDPKLPIQRGINNHEANQMGYYPSYESISPQERSCYLTWLANGKNDPDANMGYVFLYFYGLERRLLLFVGQDEVLHNEQEVIIAEIERLLSIYNENSSFCFYANSLLAYAAADKYTNEIRYLQPVPEPTYHGDLPMSLKIGIAQMSRDQIPLPSDWALNYYLSVPDPPVYSRTAAQRCYPEFKKLFTEKYTKKFGAGIMIKPNKTKLSFEYRPASFALQSINYKKTIDLPDISFVKKYINELAPLIQECHNELDSFSRFLGRNPEKGETLDALLKLPPALWPDKIGENLRRLRFEINSAAAPVDMKFSEFLSNIPAWENQSKNNTIKFLDILESHFGIGLEPDCRFNGKIPKKDSSIVLFPINDKEKEVNFLNDANYLFATIVANLSILISRADKAMSKEELDSLLKSIDNWTWIEPCMKNRLKAHAKWLSYQDISIAGVKKRLTRLSQSQKELLSSVLIQVSRVDGTVSVEELKLLEKIFKLLNMEIPDLYNKMNQSDFEPVMVAAASQESDDFSIPPPPSGQGPVSVQLDMTKVAALKADSEKAAALLSELFSLDDETDSGATECFSDNGRDEERAGLWGLSVELSEFTHSLMRKKAWTHTELEQLALKYDLMLEGALEEINDKSFDAFDEPLIDANGDIFEMNQEVVEAIASE